jgi:hypothetical protein
MSASLPTRLGALSVSGTAILGRQSMSRSALFDSSSSLGAGAMPIADSPPKAGATKARRNPPNTELRRVFERSDLPCIIDQRGVRSRLTWKIPVEKLDFSYYLPLFFDGLREEEYPYNFIAKQGVHDLLEHGGAKILPVVPQLIIPLKNAISTRRPHVMLVAIVALKQLTVSDAGLPGGGMIGRALVPYYRQILPVLNIFLTKNLNLGDKTDYGQRKGLVLGDMILEVGYPRDSNQRRIKSLRSFTHVRV